MAQAGDLTPGGVHPLQPLSPSHPSSVSSVSSSSNMSSIITQREHAPITRVVSRRSQQTNRDQTADDGDAVDVEAALKDFESLRQQLTNASNRPQAPSIRRQTITGSIKLHHGDEETGGKPADTNFIDLQEYLKRENHERESAGAAPKKIGISFRNLTVSGTGPGWIPVQTFPQKLLTLVGWDLVNMFRMSFGPSPPSKPIIKGFSGVVRPGEMLLVLGKPGSGSSTFLRALTNQPRGFTQISGEVHYAGIPFDDANGPYRGEIVFTDEDDEHLPTLTVDQTVRFALKSKTPQQRTPGTSKEAFVDQMVELFAKMFSMGNVLNTIVGNAYVRGVSGGERKRVSIMEALASRATIYAWDNSTRGLDSSIAGDYVRSLRILTTLTSSTTIATLYQVSESIFREFDKVCLIHSGRQIYFGPVTEAREYFESLGFEASPRITTSDFLTTITDENERRVRPGMENQVPMTPEQLEQAFRKSKHWKVVQSDLAAYDEELKANAGSDAENFKTAVVEDKSRLSRKTSPYTVSFPMQVLYLAQRELQLVLQDRTGLYTSIFNIIVMGLIIGSMFYQIPQTSAGAFILGGVLFFNTIVIGWLQMIEAIKMPMGRGITAKQTTLGFYRPSALILGRTIADLPVLAMNVSLFTVIMYWMAGMQADAGKFFLQLLFIYLNVVCLTAAYRAIGAFSKDINISLRIAYLFLNIIALFAGYMQPYNTMKSWVYKWIFWAQPISYALEAVMVNQFDGMDLACSPTQLVPQVPGATIQNQVCTLPGSEAQSAVVEGARYLATYGYARAHLWRNFGIICGFTLFYLSIAVIGVEYINWGGGGGLIKMFTKPPPSPLAPATDELPMKEKQVKRTTTNELDPRTTSPAENGAPLTTARTQHSLAQVRSMATSHMRGSGSIFTWRNVEYTIGADTKLLHGINGFVKPGRLTALMGPSGAGKTTLLDNLAMRKRVGVISGELLMNGKPLQPDFERSTAFVEQQDVHDWSSTVREALEFSAILRQPKSVSIQEKKEHVENLIKLLELEHLADALIGMPGYFGLSVEERKRVTIGVELAANPKELLFLDEPTSGLDSNGALSIIRLLRKLADETSIAILCTIHQPSSILFQEFDDVCLLQRGHQVYFGPIGKAGVDVIDYFQRHGGHTPAADVNPAEYILDVIRETPSEATSWGEVWESSHVCHDMQDEIETIISIQSEQPLEDRELRSLKFAMPLKDQIIQVTKRVWRHYWRDASYGYSKIFSNLSMALVAGVLFLNSGNTVKEMQSRAFAVFLMLVLSPMIHTSVQVKFLEFRSLYETRERNSKIYSAPAWIAAMALVEIPYAILSAIIFFLPWYYMVGFPDDSSRAGYAFFYLLLFQIWVPHAAMWIAAVCNDMTMISLVNPIFFFITIGVTGILVPYPQLPVFYSSWIYWINPLTWVSRGMIANALHAIPVRCSPEELVSFLPPANKTCGEYVAGWINSAPGYIVDLQRSDRCEYCMYKVGDEFLDTVNIDGVKTRWRDLGVFVAYVVVNFMLCFVAYWVVREVRWGRVWKRLSRRE